MNIYKNKKNGAMCAGLSMQGEHPYQNYVSHSIVQDLETGNVYTVTTLNLEFIGVFTEGEFTTRKEILTKITQ